MAFLMLMLILPFEQVLAQSPGTITLTGVVTEVSGAPLPGVNVFNMAIGTITDADGKYTLSVPADATITFSFTGFQTLEVPVNNRTSIDVLMTESAEVLGEVVVIG
jgi:hypothetical protein